NYLISCGANVEASGGVAGVWRHANARGRGMKRVQVEPHLSVTGACSAAWVPIRPKTDAAFLSALIHVCLHEQPRGRLDRGFLFRHPPSPYLVGPHGYYLREPATGQPILAETLEGAEEHVSLEIGADGDVLAEGRLAGETAFSKLVAHMRPYTPEWAETICDVPASTIRRIAEEFLNNAHVGQFIEIEGSRLPYRPVAISLGKTVTNGWGGFECCWARTVLCSLVGALETPGGILGTTVRLNRPMSERHRSVTAGPDGLMAYPFNPTDRGRWSAQPNIRNAYRSMVPLAGDGPWSQALGPTHFSWMFLDATPPGLPRVTLPEVWFLYRTNPAISFWDTAKLEERMARFPFVVAFAYTRDESNHFADVLLPDAPDLESLQLTRIGGSKYFEQFWDHECFALRQPAIAPRADARDITDIAIALASRCGLLEKYNASINRGALWVRLKDFSLDLQKTYDAKSIWNAVCKAASSELTGGKEAHGLEWWKEKGLAMRPFPRTAWYLYPTLVAKGLRFEMPYQERLLRIGRELGRRLHERGMTWWDKQLAEYQALPVWKDFPAEWEAALAVQGGDPADYPFWLLTARSMQYAWGGNVGV